MDNSKQPGRRIPSYAEAARGNKLLDLPSSECAPVSKAESPVPPKPVPPPTPTRIPTETPVHKPPRDDSVAKPSTTKLSAIPTAPPAVSASKKNKSWTSKGPTSSPRRLPQKAKKKRSAEKDVQRASHVQTQDPAHSEPEIPKDKFSYAEALRGKQPGNVYKAPPTPGTASSALYSPTTQTTSTEPPAPGLATQPTQQNTRDRSPLPTKSRQHQPGSNPHLTAQYSPPPPPAVPDIEFKVKPKGKGKKNRKGKKPPPNPPPLRLPPPQFRRGSPQRNPASPHKKANDKGKDPAPTTVTAVIDSNDENNNQALILSPIYFPPLGLSPTSTSTTKTLSTTNLPPIPGGTANPVDKFVETKICQALLAEELRQYILTQRSLRTQAMISAHDNRDPASGVSLWDSQYEWDVKITCRSPEQGGVSWNVHHDILTRESDWFKERLPPKDPQGGYVNFDLPTHSKEQLGHALKFMYEKRYEGATLRVDNDATNGRRGLIIYGDAIRKNVFMYICGASVDCKSMMKYAADHIDGITRFIIDQELLLPDFCARNDIFSFYHPFTLGLTMVYEQGNRPNMMWLRLAMARLVDTVLVQMWTNQTVRRSIDTEWMPALWHNVVADNVYFYREGLLWPVESHDERLDESNQLELVEVVPGMGKHGWDDGTTGGNEFSDLRGGGGSRCHAGKTTSEESFESDDSESVDFATTETFFQPLSFPYQRQRHRRESDALAMRAAVRRRTMSGSGLVTTHILRTRDGRVLTTYLRVIEPTVDDLQRQQGSANRSSTTNTFGARPFAPLTNQENISQPAAASPRVASTSATSQSRAGNNDDELAVLMSRSRRRASSIVTPPTLNNSLWRRNITRLCLPAFHLTSRTSLNQSA